MRPITTAAIIALALSACSPTGTIEGDIYRVTHDGQPMRGVAARVYLVPDSADQRLWATVDAPCTRAWEREERYDEMLRTQIQGQSGHWDEWADSVRREAEGLPPDERAAKLEYADRMLTAVQDRRNDLNWSLASGFGNAAAAWLGDSLERSYASAAVDSTEADVGGHYTFRNVPLGTYTVVAFMNARRRGSDFVGWRAAVEVTEGSHRLELDDDAGLYIGVVCPTVE